MERGEEVTLRDVDVVTTATRAVMSGTYAVLSFPVKAPFHFKRAVNVLLNDVPAHVGPCPNESLGVLDMMVFGTARSQTDPAYGAGHLFRDMVERRDIELTVSTEDNAEFMTDVDLDEMPHARLHSTRNAFMNYSAFVNCSDRPVRSIFHATEFMPSMKAATFSGCGHLNPLKNDPHLETIGVGTVILINGAQGFVIGEGTRSSPSKPNLAGFADMHGMDPELMGGFSTAAGPECIVSWAMAIPVISDTVLDAMLLTDKDIPMPVMDVDKRMAIGSTTYADGWRDTDLAVRFDPSSCLRCEPCMATQQCPLGAIEYNNGVLSMDRYLCFNCGLCSTVCPGNVFSARLGSLSFEMEGHMHAVPIVMRQSDRKRALHLAEKLRGMVLNGSFRISSPQH